MEQSTYEIHDDTESVIASGMSWAEAVRLADSYTLRTKRLHWVAETESADALA